jgi:hypothetical protein
LIIKTTLRIEHLTTDQKVSGQNNILNAYVKPKIVFMEQEAKFDIRIDEYTGEGILSFNGKDMYSASRSLLQYYRNGQKIILNKHFIVEGCPVCRVGQDLDAILYFCPECDKMQMIAYPKMDIDSMFTSNREYDQDQRPDKEGFDDSEWSFLKGSQD